MPIHPPPSVYGFRLDALDPGEEVVGVGADLKPGTILAAYRSGVFPMPIRRWGPVAWLAPDPRGVLPLDGLRVSRSLRSSVRRFQIRIDTAFDEVITACADPRRPGGWIRRDIAAAYKELHRLGWAHSVEAWTRGPGPPRLAGGLYGVAIGGLFAGESMFHRDRDASKVALVALVDLLRAAGPEGRLVDVQWATPHLESLGVVAVPRPRYLSQLADALTLEAPPQLLGPEPGRWPGAAAAEPSAQGR
jgi:leucyl/phenylalanyl-tRNA---protein transferase